MDLALVRFKGAFWCLAGSLFLAPVIQQYNTQYLHTPHGMVERSNGVGEVGGWAENLKKIDGRSRIRTMVTVSK
jgi:hypothetical protein